MSVLAITVTICVGIIICAWFVDYFVEIRNLRKNARNELSLESLEIDDQTKNSPLPPFIDSEGNMHAREGQIQTEHGILYTHPLTHQPMLLDKQGIEHDVMYELHDQTYVWNAVACQGGGSFFTPPLNRASAIDYVCRSGNVKIVYVDDNIKAIMFKQI